MKYALVVFIALAGCNSGENFTPSLDFAPASSTSTELAVTFQRGTNHSFSDLKASVNGIDLGAAIVSEGGAPTQALSTPTPSSAIWQIDPAKVGGSAHVIVDDGGEQFTLDETIDGANIVVTGCSSNLSC